jgi:DNA-binding NtrC family response regulator
LSGADAKPAVLVVDDEPAIRLLCRVNLELEGYRVLDAATLDDARGTIDREHVAVALLDMRIGSERGEDLFHELGARGIPVIVVTGSAEVDGDLKTRAAAVLGKPFALDDLLSAVRTATAAR